MSETTRHERQIGIMHLENNQYVRVSATIGVSTEDALTWVEEIIAWKRRELARIKAEKPAP